MGSLNGTRLPCSAIATVGFTPAHRLPTTPARHAPPRRGGGPCCFPGWFPFLLLPPMTHFSSDTSLVHGSTFLCHRVSLVLSAFSSLKVASCL